MKPRELSGTGRDELIRIICELHQEREHLRAQVTDLQTRCTEQLLELRALKRASGEPQ